MRCTAGSGGLKFILTVGVVRLIREKGTVVCVEYGAPIEYRPVSDNFVINFHGAGYINCI